MNFLEEYLVKLGIQIDNKQFKKAKDVLGDLSKNLEKRLPAGSATAIKAFGLLATAITGVTVETAKMVNQVAKADMQYQLLAQRMFMSVQATKAFTLASETLGANLQEIAWNVELRERYFDLVDQVNKLEIPPEARDMLKQVRSIGHEFDRLKLAGKLSLEWIAVHLLGLNKGGLTEMRTQLRSFTENIFDKIPIWTKQIATFLDIPIKLAKTVIRLFGDIKDVAMPVLELIWGFLDKIWNMMAPWQRQLIVLGALILAVFSPIVGPIAAATAAVTAFLLALDDFYAYSEGRKSSQLLAPFWEFAEFLQFTLTRSILRVIVIADHMWSALKRQRHASGLSWKQDLDKTIKDFDAEWFARKARMDAKRAEANIPEKELLNVIAKGEGTSDELARQRGFASGYDVTLGYGAYAKSSKPVSQMTFRELEEHQNRMLAEQRRRGIDPGKASSAAGKYQFTKSTLFGTGGRGGLLEQLGISKNEIFSPEIQDRLALALVKKETEQFRQGKITQAQYQNVLAGRWASVAMAGTGASRYGQRVGTTAADLATVLAGLRGAPSQPPGPLAHANIPAVPGSESPINVNVVIHAQTTDPNEIADKAVAGVRKALNEAERGKKAKTVVRKRVGATA